MTTSDGRAALLAANRRAAADFAAGRLEEAFVAWEALAKGLGPDDDDIAPAIWENVGLGRYNLGAFPAAIRAFLRALDGRLGAREQSLRFLVTCCAASGRRTDARRLLAVYEESWGEHPDGWTAESLASADAAARRRGTPADQAYSERSASSSPVRSSS